MLYGGQQTVKHHWLLWSLCRCLMTPFDLSHSSSWRRFHGKSHIFLSFSFIFLFFSTLLPSPFLFFVTMLVWLATCISCFSGSSVLSTLTALSIKRLATIWSDAILIKLNEFKCIANEVTSYNFWEVHDASLRRSQTIQHFHKGPISYADGEAQTRLVKSRPASAIGHRGPIVQAASRPGWMDQMWPIAHIKRQCK